MSKAALWGLAGAAMLAVSGGDAGATMLLPMTDTGSQGTISIAQESKEAKAAKKKKRCEFLLENCQYSSGDRRKYAKICTVENVKFMEEHCLPEK